VKKLAQQRTEAFLAFVEQQGWQLTEELSPSFALYTRGRRSFAITDGETSVTVSIGSEGGLDLRGENGKLKTRLLEWIRQVQPRAMVLKRELRSYQSSRAKSRMKAWTFDRGSWHQIEEGRYNRLGEGADREEAIHEAGYESGMPIRLHTCS
jgi:hypothetical protein